MSNAATAADFVPFASGPSGSIEIGTHGDLHAVARIDTVAGGAVIVLAPTIVNDGVITSPDGQVILAAGNKAFLFANPDTNDFTMRGLFVEIEADGAPVNLTKALRSAIPGRHPGDLSAKTGDVFNLGEIHTDRGNTTLAGLAVNQAGLVSAKTAVNQNGSIWLLAKSGRVTTTTGSRTETPIDDDKVTSLKEDQDFTIYRPVVKVEANQILHQGSIVAPDGVVSLSAAGAGSRIILDNGSSISVAGSWVDLPLDKNLVTFTVTSNDLKDDPQQKGGFLLGKKVTVDLRTDPALFDLATKKSAVSRTVAEKTTAGGDITIAAGDNTTPGDIILRENATLDVTGGGYRYADGSLSTTKLVSEGKVYDIGAAPADLKYDTLLQGVSTKSYKKWNVNVLYAGFASTGSSREAGYVEGKSGGNIALNASNVVLDGELRAGSTAGPFQNTPSTKPSGGSLTIGDTSALTGGGIPDFRVTDIILQDAPFLLPAGFGFDESLPDDRKGKVYLAARKLSDNGSATPDSYTQQGFSNVKLFANGRIELPAESDVQAAPGANLTLTAGEIAIAGTIDAAGGTVTLKAQGTAFRSGDLAVPRDALANPPDNVCVDGAR